jgi:RNA recognition motif-containing protein
MNIYVGNLSRDASEADIRQAFEEFGAVSSVAIIKDRITGDPRGFGFVEMASRDEALNAITNLNGRELKGRTLNVNEARPKTDRGGSGGGGGDRRSFRGGGGGGGGRRGW